MARKKVHSHTMSTKPLPEATNEQASPLRDEQGPIPQFPPVALDPVTGRRLPESPEEAEARRAAAIRVLKIVGNITDEHDTEENWIEAMRDIDAYRPHRPLFKGIY